MIATSLSTEYTLIQNCFYVTMLKLYLCNNVNVSFYNYVNISTSLYPPRLAFTICGLEWFFCLLLCNNNVKETWRKQKLETLFFCCCLVINSMLAKKRWQSNICWVLHKFPTYLKETNYQPVNKLWDLWSVFIIFLGHIHRTLKW